MNRKILVIAGILGFLILAFVVFNFIGQDKSKPELAAILGTNAELVELGNLGTQRVSSSEHKQTAVNMATVTMSDNRTLSSYWQERIGKKLPQDDKEAKQRLGTITSELEAISHVPTFDSRWLELVKERLNANATRLKAVYSSTKSAQLRGVVEKIYNNQQLFLEQLDSN